MNEAEMIRLLIVGDQPGVRRGLLMRLAAEADFDVIGEAADVQTALRLVALLAPDVVLVDVDMPGLDGMAMTSALCSLCPNASTIMLSFRDDVHTRSLAEQTGAAAFVVKSLPAAALLSAIRQVSRAGRVLA
jgi:DNA-binding NarL/FixJ family response regulator